MRVLGIVAEYNPFHLGHRYHLRQAQRESQAEGTIVMMSGHFMQRGEAAIMDKWSRAHMALLNGADLVLELPTAFACRSANHFALGAVLSLAKTNLVTHLAFGVEQADLAQLNLISDILADEPLAYQQQLKYYLAEGYLYPQAQQMALTPYLANHAFALNQPNNILALNYMQVIKRHQLPMIPVPIKRQGQYHSQSLDCEFASATAIRTLLYAGQLDQLAQHMPKNCLPILQEQLAHHKGPVSLEQFAPTIFALLRRSTPEQIGQIQEMTEGLENRFYRAGKGYHSIDALILAIKSKRYTYTRIQRALVHLLLNYTKDMQFQQPHYLRVLGFTRRGQQLLKQLKTSSDLPIITKVGHNAHQLSAEGQQMLALDFRATDLYSLAYPPALAYSGYDYYQSPIRCE